VDRTPDVSSPAGLVIFDCDGVLVDSERMQVDIEVRYLAELGWPLTFDEVVAHFMGRTEAAMLADIEEHLGAPAPADWFERFSTETQTALDERLEPVSGVRAAIERLQRAGWETCVGSSGTPDRITRSLTTTKLLDLLDGRLFSGTEVPNGKPAPDLFLHAARTLGFAPGACIVVEDSPYGIEAARAAGMNVVGYAGGVIPTERLVDADVIIDDMAALPDTVEGLSAEVEPTP
jgi:HAD superfamily hydrolase (TIGR01509 family)